MEDSTLRTFTLVPDSLDAEEWEYRIKVATSDDLALELERRKLAHDDMWKIADLLWQGNVVTTRGDFSVPIIPGSFPVTRLYYTLSVRDKQESSEQVGNLD
jgi:hypothetical protein